MAPLQPLTAGSIWNMMPSGTRWKNRWCDIRNTLLSTKDGGTHFPAQKDRLTTSLFQLDQIFLCFLWTCCHGDRVQGEASRRNQNWIQSELWIKLPSMVPVMVTIKKTHKRRRKGLASFSVTLFDRSRTSHQDQIRGLNDRS